MGNNKENAELGVRSSELPFPIPHSPFRTPKGLRTIRVGHTPDMDDAFMFYAIAKQLIPMDGLQIEHVIEDIQTLNRRALDGDLAMTAVSAAGYPAIASQYWIAAVGSRVGPVVLFTPP